MGMRRVPAKGEFPAPFFHGKSLFPRERPPGSAGWAGGCWISLDPGIKRGGKNREFLDKPGMFSCFSKATPDVPAAPNPRLGSSQEPFSRETPGIPAFFRVLGSPGTIPAGITMDFTGKIPPVIPNSSPSLSLSPLAIPAFPAFPGISFGIFRDPPAAFSL